MQQEHGRPRSFKKQLSDPASSSCAAQSGAAGIKMRRTILIPLLVLFTTCLYVLVSHILAFIQIFFEHSGIAVTQEEINAAYLADGAGSRPQLIPKLIHHIFHNWHNVSMPKHWEETRQTCIDQNKDWEYKLWTEESSREFLSVHYPWFLGAYDGYPYPVQRVDVVKYFAMLHYGGIYLDMDNGCSTDLNPVLYYPTWTTDGGRGALSNNILGSTPGHPFWQLLTDSLIPYSYNFAFPYITISYASGQWFETAVWDAYHAALPATEAKLHRIMMDDRPGSAPWVYFTQTTFGGTWNSWDNRMFLWIGDHLILLAVFVVGCIVLVCWTGMRLLRRRRPCMLRGESYLPLVHGEMGDEPDGVEINTRRKEG